MAPVAEEALELTGKFAAARSFAGSEGFGGTAGLRCEVEVAALAVVVVADVNCAESEYFLTTSC